MRSKYAEINIQTKKVELIHAGEFHLILIYRFQSLINYRLLIPQRLPVRRLTEADYQHITEIWETSGKHLGNIMSMNCTFCTRFPQNIRPFLPLRLLFDILIVKHYCQNTHRITTFTHVLQILLAKLIISHDFTFILHVFLAECVYF